MITGNAGCYKMAGHGMPVSDTGVLSADIWLSEGVWLRQHFWPIATLAAEISLDLLRPLVAVSGP
jgi:hypothetical protein